MKIQIPGAVGWVIFKQLDHRNTQKGLNYRAGCMYVHCTGPDVCMNRAGCMYVKGRMYVCTLYRAGCMYVKGRMYVCTGPDVFTVFLFISSTLYHKLKTSTDIFAARLCKPLIFQPLIFNP